MRLIGFNFTKIYVERFKGFDKDLKVNTNIDISDVKKTDIDFFKSKEEFVSVKFKYSINYEPDSAKIEFEGDMIVSAEPKQIKDLMKKWEKKDVSDEFRPFLFNIILRKSNVRAIQLEEEMNLPFHIPLPRISPKNKE